MESQISKAEQLAIELLRAIDPSLEFTRDVGIESEAVKEGEVVLCTDVEAEHPYLAAYVLARDAIWFQRCRNSRPSLEMVTWNELCDGLREAAFAGLSLLYREIYYKDEYVGSSLKHMNGKLVYLMRPASDEEKKKNQDAKVKMKMVQAMWDSAQEVAKEMGGTPKKKRDNSWTFH